MINDVGCPVSSIILSLDTGSRTIVYHNCLPELTLKNFEQLNLEEYSWIHFEVCLIIYRKLYYMKHVNCFLFLGKAYRCSATYDTAYK